MAISQIGKLSLSDGMPTVSEGALTPSSLILRI
jgi:hypothetical protein